VDNSNLHNAKKMFKHACAFAECAYFCETEPAPIKIRTQWHTIPNIVNSVFACEVYIKSILVYCGMTHAEIKHLSHGLVGLWDKLKELDAGFATMIENAIKECFRTSNESLFDEKLEEISNAFKEWRYIYEGFDVKINRNFLIILRNYLRDGCCLKYYDKNWQSFVESGGKWETADE